MPIISGGGGGGFAPVSCVAIASALDLHAPGGTAIKWTGIVDNLYNFNSLTAIPAGLGITFAFDGSSPAMTTTSDGIWAFSSALFGVADATWIATLTENFGANGQQIATPQSTALGTLGVVLALPSGAGGEISVQVTTGATANPYNVLPQLSIVRLA